MKTHNFWVFSMASVGFAVTSLFRPNVFVLPGGFEVYLGIKAFLVTLILFSVFRMQGNARQGSTTSDLKSKVATRTADPLLSLRALACMMVLFGHAFLVEFPPANLYLMLERNWPIWMLTASPWAGVWVFFTLSGYLMGKGFHSRRYVLTDGSLHSFLANRILRIAPTYFIATLLVSLLVCPAIFLPKNLWMLFLILIFDYQGNLSINPIGALWSVSTEMQFYLLVPLFFWLLSQLNRFSAKFVAALPFLIFVLSETVKGSLSTNFNAYHYIYTPLVSNLDCFLIGMSANFSIQYLQSTSFASLTSLPQGAVLLGIFYLIISYFSAAVSADGNKLRHFYVIAPGLTALVTATVIILWELTPSSRNNDGFLGFLIRRTQAFGILTYCIYTWHAPVFISLRTIAPKSLSLLQSVTLGFVAIGFTVLVAVLFYYSIELPFDRLKKSRAFPRLPVPEELLN